MDEVTPTKREEELEAYRAKGRVIGNFLGMALKAWFVMLAVGVLASKGAIGWTLSYWEALIVYLGVQSMVTVMIQQVKILK